MEKLSLRNELFQLSVSAKEYEFPEALDHNDASWLLIQVDIEADGQKFENTSPALTTKDLHDIAQWFDRLSRRRLPRRIDMSFMEPNLEFRVLRSTDEFVAISVHLSHESRPPFKMSVSTVDYEICFFKHYQCRVVECCSGSISDVKEVPCEASKR